MSKINKSVDIIIHYRDTGCKYRNRNLEILIDFLNEFFDELANIIIIEQDIASKIDITMLCKKLSISHHFLYNPNIYNRGWAKNFGVAKCSKSDIAVIIDNDMIPTKKGMVESIDALNRGYVVASPYKSVYYTTELEREKLFNRQYDSLNRPNGIPFPVTITGGIVVVDRFTFIKIGGFQQYMGYGSEDRSLDVKYLQVIPNKVYVSNEIAYHLWHPRDDQINEKVFVHNALDRLKSDYGCSFHSSIPPDGNIHAKCSHKSKDDIYKKISLSKPLFAYKDLYQLPVCSLIDCSEKYVTYTDDNSDNVPVRILIFTDSRGQHKPAGSSHELFAERLARNPKYQVDMFLCPMKWTTTLDFLEFFTSDHLAQYDHIILYTGIVEWSPRPLLSARDDLYDNRNSNNSINVWLNTCDYSKKIINNKKSIFDKIFGTDAMASHLARPFDTFYEGQPTMNMYSLEMAVNSLIPLLASINNLIFINANRIVPGWDGDFMRGRPENINVIEKYSNLFAEKLILSGVDLVDLREWSFEDVKYFTCDNMHLTKHGSDFIYDKILAIFQHKKIINSIKMNAGKFELFETVHSSNQSPQKINSSDATTTLNQAIATAGSHNIPKSPDRWEFQRPADSIPNSFAQVNKPEASQSFSFVSPNCWTFTKSLDSDKQKQLIFPANSPCPTEDRELLAVATLETNVYSEVEVSLGRHGSGAYEGKAAKIHLGAGQSTPVIIGHKFISNHEKIKFQLKILSCAGDSAEVKVSEQFIFQSPESMVASLDKGEDVFALANSKFREARYLESAPLYLHLAHQEPRKAFHREMAEVAFQEAGIANAELIKKILFTLGVGLVTSK